MANGIFNAPVPVNEPVRAYAPGSPEKASLKSRLSQMLGERVEVPLILGGEEVRTGNTADIVCPHDHGHVLGTFHQAGEAEVQRAIEASRRAWITWSEMVWEDRAAIFLKAADLLAGPWRDTINAATMLNQSKTVFQAEIDSACELIDFFRFNVHYMRQMYTEQPLSVDGIWNRVEYRPLEGYVFAVTPFNFTSIGGNLPTAPAMMGNVALWKPASTAVLSAYYIMKMLEEAGLPPGVINLVPGRGAAVGDPALASEHFAGLHFTGSTATFQGMWKTIGENIQNYRSYPRIVGETGGKDFVFAHPSADPDALVTALVRGAFEYQGQKCSAASRAYVPSSLWSEVREKLTSQIGTIAMGPPTDFRNFMAAVIDAKAFRTHKDAIERARASSDAEILCGGACDDSVGYYVEPTVIVASDPAYETMKVELFGPILTIYVYDDAALEATLDLCDTTSDYALTGGIFARDRGVIAHLAQRLRHTAGNFYINDKPTGAVVGQQPFGGARASGTNDKAGSIFNLLRWVNQRAMKETFVPPTDYRYPFMGEE
ncbi:MAG: L-glutamate gamma-semialdehyde dehydrogenase [Thermoanaerobaculia bacterium]|nr:L-glutamate gamma-semialdehyde dehydrogenase [Thermoanaerobaculia bacterium]